MYKGFVLLDNFKEFYAILKNTLRNIYEKIEPEALIIESQKPLLQCIYTQKKKIEDHYIGDERTVLAQGLYLQASLADELFLRTDWSGRDLWKEKMLEHQIFNTQHAGVHIPQEVIKIIQHSQNYAQELIELYYLVLSLGFKGGLEEKMVFQLKRKLLAILYPSEEFLFTKKQTTLMPQAMESIIPGQKFKFVMDTQSWFYAFVLFLIIFTVITSYVWYYYQHDIYEVLKQLYQKTSHTKFKFINIF